VGLDGAKGDDHPVLKFSTRLKLITWSLLTSAATAPNLGLRIFFFFAIFAGLLGWFVQGFGEFSLYVPVLAWTAFTLLGSLIGFSGKNEAASVHPSPIPR
jgi:hypothetical protein